MEPQSHGKLLMTAGVHVQRSTTYTSLLRAGPRLKPLQQVHAYIIALGSSNSRSLLTKLLTLACNVSCSVSYTHKILISVPNPDAFLFNTLIRSTSRSQRLSAHALYYYSCMIMFNIESSNYTFTYVIKSCTSLLSRKHGRIVHGHVLVNGYGTYVYVQSALVAFYTKVEQLGDAGKVFENMPERSVVAWNSLISGYEQHGLAKESIDLFDRMRETGSVAPDATRYVVVLAACAQLGGLGLGRWVHDYVVKKGLVVTVVLGTALIHMHVALLQGRAGLLSEAYKFVQESVPPYPAPPIWTAMLGVCKMHKDFDLGAEVAEHLLAIEPENHGHYVMLSNIYASARRMDRVEMIRDKIINKSLRKIVGYSIIEIDGRSYLFSMGDKSHLESNAIFNYLDELISKCAEAGYIFVMELVMHEVEEEEREYALRYESEKLAIAFGLLKTAPGSTIRLVKNIRMWEESHSAIKYIYVITGRNIVVRDKLRFHHFKDGSCSCSDY
ncbi:unnamed protein product [Linum trigynum]|uniref:DYW domain-containing protein n=1 Tax=Linum trigynum TaxID=586398 RepID=A0AAV2G9Q2_9ROSI